jgi:hypothetical protein
MFPKVLEKLKINLKNKDKDKKMALSKENNLDKVLGGLN